MKVILWLQSPQLPLLNQAINVVAKTYGALEFVGAIVQESARGGGGKFYHHQQSGDSFPR